MAPGMRRHRAMAPEMPIAAEEEGEAWDDDDRTVEEVMYHVAEVQRNSEQDPFVAVNCLADFQAVVNFPADEAYVGITHLAVLSVSFIEAPILLGSLRKLANSEKDWVIGNLFKLREAVDLCARVRSLEGLATTLQTKLELDDRSLEAMKSLEPVLIPLSAHQSGRIRSLTGQLREAVEDLLIHADGGGFTSDSVASRLATIQSRIDKLKEEPLVYPPVGKDEYVSVDVVEEDESSAADPFVRIFSLAQLTSYLAEASKMLLPGPICVVRLELASSTRMYNMIQDENHHRLGLWVGNMDLLRQASKLNIALSGLLLSLKDIQDAVGNDEIDWFQVGSVSRVVNSLMPLAEQQPIDVRAATEDLVRTVEEMLANLPPKPEDINESVSTDCFPRIVTQVDSLIVKVTNLQALRIVYPDADAPPSP